MKFAVKFAGSVRSPILAIALSFVGTFSLLPFLAPMAALAEEEGAVQAAKTYLEFHEQLPNAKSIDGLSKYFSKAKWAIMAKDEKTMPKDQFEMTFELFKKLSPSKVIVVGQSLVGDTCVLNLKAPDENTAIKDPLSGTNEPYKSSGSGTVTMRKEDGNWKIDMEEWQCSEVVGDGPAVSSRPESAPETAVSATNLDAAAVAK